MLNTEICQHIFFEHETVTYNMVILIPALNTKPSEGAQISGKVGLLVGGKTKGS